MWVRQFVGLPLLHVVSASISFFVSLVVVDFFFRGEKGCRGFFSKEEEEETEVSWVSFVELECLKLEFHVNLIKIESVILDLLP